VASTSSPGTTGAAGAAGAGTGAAPPKAAANSAVIVALKLASPRAARSMAWPRSSLSADFRR
jgi:hypothetical protein